MNTRTQIRPVPAGPDQYAEMQHVVCCRDMDTALCGLDVSGHEWGQGHEPLCPACEGLSGPRGCRRVLGFRFGCPIGRRA